VLLLRAGTMLNAVQTDGLGQITAMEKMYGIPTGHIPATMQEQALRHVHIQTAHN
jgi:hypothetical protein